MANNQIELPESFRDANTYKNQYSTLQTNLNVSPYYDDYNVDNQFYRLLFKPGYAVQARELTQIQSMLQNQITKFGKHVFKEGSIVLGGQFAIEKYDYVKVADLDTNNQTVDITKFEKQTFTNPTTGLTAYVHKVVDGSQTATDQKMLFVRYTNSGSVGAYAGVTKTFSAGDTIVSDQGTLKVLGSLYTPIGYGSIFFVSEGIIFAKNHFLSFPTQSVIVDRYTTSATCRVGFIITEDIIRYSDDISLLDPALESSNYSAPGADRLKLTPYLTRKEISDNPGPPDYVDLIEIRNGVITETFEQSQYARLGDEFASRTFDESGDYYVNGLTVQIKEHLDNGVNGGKYTANTDPVGDSTKLTIGVESGTAYVKGYKVWTGGLTKWVDTDKATAFANVNNQISGSNLGNYFVCKEYCGSWAHDTGTLVSLYDTAQTAITSKTLSNTVATGNVVGTAKVKAVEYSSGLLGSSSGRVEIYLFDIKINSGYTLSQAKSLVGTGTANMFADIVLETDGTAMLYDTLASVLLYNTGSAFTKTVRGSDGTQQTTFIHKRSKDINISSTGEIILSVDDLSNEEFPYGSGAYLGSDEKREITLNLTQSFNIAMTGYAATTSGSKTVTGVNTKFTRLNAGDKVTFTDIGGTYIIDFITNDTVMNLTTTASGTDSNTAFSKVYIKGDAIDLNSKGSDAGAVRTVQQTSSTSMTIELNETLGATKTGTLSYRIYRRETKEIPKLLRSSRYVIINCSTAGTTGPFNLGISDVYRINSIRKNTGAFSLVTDGSDVTSGFVLDKGQRDELYDHAKITPTISLASTDYLLIDLDYFYPDYTDSASAGYFSVNSYPINDSAVSSTTIQTPQIPLYKSPVNGVTYDLRNCLDFRPVKQNTANDSTTLGGASTNPATTNTFFYSGLGYRMPAPSSQIQYDYSYYLARRDIVVIDKNGIISVIEGVPSVVPITPETPPNVMNIANLFIAPYPSLSPYYANILNRMDLACISKKTANIRFTMRDIGVLKSRIENLEYYNSLNALEKKAADFVVLDQNNLDRFKNGIFVDTFRDHTLGATNRPDYKISVDSRESSIRPVYDMEDLYYRLVPNSNTNVTIHGSLMMMDYTDETMIEQAAVTTYRNIETSVYRYVGNTVLNPDTDVWVDTQTVPDNQITFGSDVKGGQVLQSEYNAWQSKVVGYKLFQEGKLIGTYDNLAEATASASAISGYFNRKQGGNYGTIKPVYLETTYDNTRSGREVVSDVYTSTQSLGNRVVDVEIIPYIRPQIIKFFASGMKAITRHYVYFDGVDMSKYVTPTWSQWSKIIPVTSTNEDGTIVEGWIQGPPEGSMLTSDEYGNVWGELRIPADGPKFRIGTKEVVITDSPLNDDSATSTSVSYFVSQGLVQTKQDTILTTRQLISLQKEVSEYQQTTTAVVVNPRYGDSCTAYSFMVKAPEGEEGIFLSSVDIWLASVDVDNQRGVWFEIKEMDNGGGVTRTQVPLSEVWYDADYMNQFVITPEDINALTTSEAKKNLFDESYFRVKFRAPVFLYKDRQYAFTIHTQGVNPYTYFWMSKYGENDLITGNQVTARPMTGTLFVTNNNLNWTQVIGWDLKVRFNRAKFKVNNPATSNALGTFTLTNELYERPLFKAVSNTPYQGEKLVSNRIRLTNPNLNTKIEVGDRIVTFVNVITTNTITNVSYSNTVSSNISVIAIHDTTANTFNVANSVYFVNWDDAKGFWNPLDVWGPTNKMIYRDYYYSNLANYATQTVSGIKINGSTTFSFEFDDAIKNGKLLYVYSANGAPRLDANGQQVTVNVASYFSKSISVDRVEDLYSDRLKPSQGDFYATLTTATTPREYSYVANTLSYNVVNTVTTTVTNVNTVISQAVTVGYYRASARTSSGNLNKDDIFIGQDSGVCVIMKDISRFSYSTLDFEPAELLFNDSSIKYEIKTTQNGVSPTVATSYIPLKPADNFYFSTEQVILSKSEEDLLIGGRDSQDIKVTMYTMSDYTSPVIDLARTHGIFVHNIINSDITNETAPSGGSLINKYISKTVTLAEGQDAEDIKLLLTAYRPTDTDVRVWAKIRHDEDIDFFDSRDWVELTSTAPNLYSATSDINDWKEFEYNFPSDYDEIITCTAANTLPSTLVLAAGNTLNTTNITANITGSRIGYIFVTDNKGFVLNQKANVVNSNGYVIGNTIISGIGRTASINANTNIVEYWTQTGVNFKGYKQFSIKIGLASNNSAIVPRVADVRTIALQA